MLNFDEADYLRKNAPNMTIPELTVALGKSYRELYRWLRSNGIAYKRVERCRWTASRKRFVRDNYERLSDAEMARELKTTHVAVSQQRCRLGLHRTKKPLPPVVPEGFTLPVSSPCKNLTELRFIELDFWHWATPYIIARVKGGYVLFRRCIEGHEANCTHEPPLEDWAVGFCLRGYPGMCWFRPRTEGGLAGSL